MMRARLTVQHAHRYFTQALKICDDLHGGPPEPLVQSEEPTPAGGQVRRGMGKLDLSVKLPKTGSGMFGRFGATMKVLDYQSEYLFALCLSNFLPLLVLLLFASWSWRFLILGEVVEKTASVYCIITT